MAKLCDLEMFKLLLGQITPSCQFKSSVSICDVMNGGCVWSIKKKKITLLGYDWLLWKLLKRESFTVSLTRPLLSEKKQGEYFYLLLFGVDMKERGGSPPQTERVL